MPGFKSVLSTAQAHIAKAFEIPPSLKAHWATLPQRPGTAQQRFQACVASWKENGPEVFEAMKKLEKTLNDLSAVNNVAKIAHPNSDPAVYDKYFLCFLF